MNTIRVNRRSLGINFTARGESEILVWAPHAASVSVYLPEREENISLIRQAFGYWSCITSKLKPGDRYFFTLNESEYYPDPASLSQPDSINSSSEVVTLSSYNWTDHTWKNFPLSEYIFYELHTGTFTPVGTLTGIEKKLDYLVELGITAIELMPVAQFSGERNWGYDGVLPFAVQNSYGGAEALQHFVNACHARNIAVVLDVVYNHVGPEGNNLEKFGPYFTDKYKTPWGKAINFDDAGCDAVRKYFIENALMWFRDFHIDALRLDAVHAIKDFSPIHILKELKLYTDELMRETGRTHYLIAECDLNDVKYIQPVDKGGYGMDAQWVDEFHHALRVTAGNERTGYYQDFDGMLHLAKSFHDAYVFDGMYSAHREKIFGTKTTGIAGEKFVVFSQNHDQVGNRMLGERTSILLSFEMQKVLAGACFVSPFLPMLFMGEEYGEKNPFQYFVNHSDEELVKAVREGRKKEFEAFQKGNEVPDPQAEKTFLNSKLQWQLIEQEPHATLLRYYRELISLRKNNPALRELDRNAMHVKVVQSQNVLVIHRWHKQSHAIAVMNFSKEAQEIENTFTDQEWFPALLSAEAKWLGPITTSEQANTNKFSLTPESFSLYFNRHV